ncbi:MAG TPA: hypothetical protein VJU59_17180 [Paraburkholderia sp.]|uniref:hypothetical protein n=1 Tax=Paraburkholderia sp. TaxID=1926495 RepID=UPI002B4A0058|nr:hypothetical protein [Paraburkholderia sp.]HKR41381.1 hypothetical protein [Paraburkholderia sp.]
MFEIAWAEALERHSGQKYGPHDYSFHLQMVVDRIRSVYGDDELELAAGALHDTIEDTGATRNYLAGKYGADLATLVWAVSADPTKVVRRDKQKSIVDKLATLPDHLRIRGIDLKLSDRNANMRASIDSGQFGLLTMYQKERGLYEPYSDKGIRICSMNFSSVAPSSTRGRPV